jgi:hypothetical protein
MGDDQPLTKRRLPQIDWLWVQLFVANILIILGLKIWSFQRILSATTWIADRTRRQQAGVQDVLIARIRVRVQQIKRRGPVRGKCLSRSMALYSVLRRYNIYSTIQIGVRKNMAEFAAHAWVEVDGQPINAGNRVRVRHAVFECSFGG